MWKKRQENPHYLIQPSRQTFMVNSQENCILQGVYFISGFWYHSRVLFTGNTVNCKNAQGITLFGSVLELEGTNHIYHNRDHYGGGIAMHDNSQLWIRNGSTLNVSDNHAFVRGGGIFISDYCTTVHSGKCPCFFESIGSDGQPLRNTSIDTFNASVTLHENSVRKANSGRATMIFNPNIDHCTLQGSFEDSTNNKLFQQVFGIPDKTTPDEISSTPRRICNCSDDGDEASNCTAWGELVVYPGQTLSLRVRLIGDMGISLENVMYIQLETSRFANDTKVYVPLFLHSTHVLNRGCNKLTIPPLLTTDQHKRNWVLQLMVPLLPDRNRNIFLFEHVETKTLDCPIAYHLVETNHLASCTCYDLLKKKVKCLLEIQQFTLPKHYWIGTEDEQEENLPTKVLLSTNCPQIYCATATEELNVSLSKPDKQCKHGRTGVLCGQCPKGKSVVYNSYACKDCTNWSILLLIPFLIAGPVLIALICCLNLTVEERICEYYQGVCSSASTLNTCIETWLQYTNYASTSLQRSP